MPCFFEHEVVFIFSTIDKQLTKNLISFVGSGKVELLNEREIMRTREYDLNVYVVDGVASLSAYEYTYSDAPNPEPNGTNTENYTTLRVPMSTMRSAEVAFLVRDPNWASNILASWDDYDSPWENMAWLDTAPPSIKQWADALPEYTPQTRHEYSKAEFDLAYGESRDIKCLYCDEVYTQRRLSFEDFAQLN